MKKLLAILGAVGLTATSASAVVSCSGDKPTTKVKDLSMDIIDNGNTAEYTVRQKIKIYNDFDISGDAAINSYGVYFGNDSDARVAKTFGITPDITGIRLANDKDAKKVGNTYGADDKNDKEVTVNVIYTFQIDIRNLTYIPEFTFCLDISYAELFFNSGEKVNKHKDSIDGENTQTGADMSFTPIAGNMTISIPSGPHSPNEFAKVAK